MFNYLQIYSRNSFVLKMIHLMGVTTFLARLAHFCIQQKCNSLVSIDCALFCTVLADTQNSTLFFQSIPHSLAKHPGVGMC